MWRKLVDDLVKIFNEDAFINLVIKERVESLKEEEKKLYTKILYGVVENKKWLDYLLKPYTTGKRFKPIYKNTLRVGVYAISYLNVADHHIVNSLVEMIKKKDFKGSKAINSILRNYIKDNRFEKASEEINKLDTIQKETIIYNIEEDILKLIKTDYPNDYHDILKNETEYFNNYRINYLLTNDDEVINYLDSNNIEYNKNDEQIITKANLIQTDIFNKGYIILQDASSCKVAKVVDPLPGSDVLDSCAAPGSKSFHMATIMKNSGSITSCDIYPHKVKLIEDEANRLGINIIKAKVADACNQNYNLLYDYVLCDVPCSGMGTMKHKPDVKLRLTCDKVNEIVNLQKDIINNVSKYVKVGGVLVYSTCTINKNENERQIECFLNNHKNYEKIYEESILPSSINDGFYICKLIRKE